MCVKTQFVFQNSHIVPQSTVINVTNILPAGRLTLLVGLTVTETTSWIFVLLDVSSMHIANFAAVFHTFSVFSTLYFSVYFHLSQFWNSIQWCRSWCSTTMFYATYYPVFFTNSELFPSKQQQKMKSVPVLMLSSWYNIEADWSCARMILRLVWWLFIFVTTFCPSWSMNKRLRWMSGKLLFT